MTKLCKSVAFLRRRKDVGREEFMRYYEEQHAPLMLSLLPGIVRYQRNYADFTSAFKFEDAADFDFDVVTEIWFESRAAYDAAMVISNSEEIEPLITADAEKIFDRSGTRMFLVDERTSGD